MRCVSRFMVSGVLLAALSAAPLATAGPSLTSVEDNVAYAVGALCAPFVLDHADRSSLPIGRGFVQADGHDGLGRPNPTGVRIGMAGFVHVTFSEASSGSRSCNVEGKGADPQALRKAALTELAKRAEHFAPTRSKYLPGRFDTEDMLCAAADSLHPAASVLLSSPHREESSRVAILFTLGEGAQRAESCDHEGVRMNFRTLANPQ